MGQAAAAVTRVAAVGHSGPIRWTSFCRSVERVPRGSFPLSVPLTASLAVLTFVHSVKNLPSTKTRPGPSVGITATTERKAWSCRTGLKSRRTISAHSGWGSRRIASSRRRRAWSCPPRTCTTRRRTAGRSSTDRPASGASTPATAGRRSSRRSSPRPPSSTLRRPSSSAIRSPSNWPTAWSTLRPRGLSTSCTPIPARNRSTRR